MNRAGTYVINMSGEAEYRSFCPSPLPPDPPVALSEETQCLLQDAAVHLAELRTASGLIPDMGLFVSTYVRKEALLSSQIEGTQCTLEDVLDPGAEENANLDVSDVINYVNAVNYAVERLKTLPLSNRLLREIHGVLLQGVCGQEKNHGELRRSQNWIGAANCGLKNARYIPPNVEDMESAMSALEKYMNNCEEGSPLVRAALIHYQFETIHPFLDGNGRIGRLLIVLYLMEQRILDVPAIYVSYFLKSNQVEYYDRISEVRRTGNYEQWIHFFLEALNAAAQDAMESIRKLIALRADSLKNFRKQIEAWIQFVLCLIIWNAIRLLISGIRQRL